MKFQDIGKKELLELGLVSIKGYGPLRDLAKKTNDKFQIWEVNSEHDLMIFPLYFYRYTSNSRNDYKLCIDPYEYYEHDFTCRNWHSLNPNGYYASEKYSYKNKKLEPDYFKLISEVDFAHLPLEYVRSCCDGAKQKARIVWLQEYLKGNVDAPYIEENDKSLQEELARQVAEEKDAEIRSLNAKISKLMGEKEELLNIIKEKEREIKDYKKLFSNTTKIKESLHALLDEIDNMF